MNAATQDFLGDARAKLEGVEHETSASLSVSPGLAPDENGATGGEWGPMHAALAGGATLLFGLAVILVIARLIRDREDADVDTITRAIGLPLIITSAVFLVILGFSKDQYSPVIGLLGTVAGYLLGRGAAPGRNKKPGAGDGVAG